MLACFFSLLVLETIQISIFSVLELLVVPFITLFYFLFRKKKSLYFSLFLGCYSAADILHIIDGNNLNEIFYFACNILYVLSFFFLILEAFKTLDIKVLYQKFLIQTIVLVALVFYLFTVLCDIIDPILFDTKVLSLVRVVEHSYNLLLLILLAVSFLNFLDNDTKKSLYLFIGCLAISFSEFLLIGYYYLTDLEMLNYIAIVLNIFAFVMFYLQSNFAIEVKNKSNAFV
ncbi:hypothetical protein KO494_13865 [Lacinutrix sp. C3R15]|uniref:hypothetical protein n=1 Tax=Flavobacteriaceae TaxID=49546 RepID=UPI001C0A0110|nr:MULTISPECIES: hypothetical protein [Flavobacteriaceae]MBU2940629.1 hypothetical protein [Lacinutrix sp. C3R15]MDO6623947.1 hypothetical protein [Oceanihabitans sp. 1_MG-2023]